MCARERAETDISMGSYYSVVNLVVGPSDVSSADSARVCRARIRNFDHTLNNGIRVYTAILCKRRLLEKEFLAVCIATNFWAYSRYTIAPRQVVRGVRIRGVGRGGSCPPGGPPADAILEVLH